MLPNWLLGKSKSKLQEILGGGGGGTDYTAGDGIDISNGVISFDPLTAPAIDPSKVDGLDDELAALAPKTALSNPNILHNPWFTVNQRDSGTITVGGNYPCDRWRTAGAGTLNITATADGLAIVNTSSESDAYVIQRRTATYVNSLREHTLTGSIMLSDGTIYSGTIESPYEDNTYFENDDVKLYTNFNTSSVEAFCIQVKAGKSLTIRAVKLEVGEISTLHLDPRPEYATELAKCMRYFQRVSGNANFILPVGFASSATRVDLAIPLPSNLRGVVPTISLHGSLKIGFSGNITSSTIALIGLSRNIIGINITTSDMSPGAAERIAFATADSYIDINAEL